ncbi:putative phosphate permease [Litorimonas cladophorae]|uniref:Phosphate transporter n=1 Tax=Litorimonas cladophorae TaxID=1220491 RepID=A0A918NFZ0_9PROT|nr:inorganic phosphate transporter [Litorimonas cladophorae]GGX67729.1 putative phosphate permease [Litorimonas cladophorae]
MSNPLPTSQRKIAPADIFRLLGAILFLVLVYVFVQREFGALSGDPSFLIFGAVVGGYMAMNIGANDVANNVGPAVGSGALGLGAAIIIAFIAEASGALIAGGDVVSTIKGGIIDPNYFKDELEVFVWVMASALLAAALWLNLATFIGAPVSTTHSIVGGVMGAGIAAGGWAIADWSVVGKIVASWVISPAMGGGIAALTLYFVRRTVLDQSDIEGSAKRVVPILVGVMAWSFSTYLILKGLKKIIKIEFVPALGIGFIIGLAVLVITGWLLRRAPDVRKNTKKGVDHLFMIPLIVAATLLSFAHGANDVANAVGPLAAINTAIQSGEVASKAGIPIWVMLIGAVGIAVGLALYGPKLIRTVGSEITTLNMTRAFCVALAAAITVIIASQLGLPVSSTHITIGGIFGIGFLREALAAHEKARDDWIAQAVTTATDFTARYEAAVLNERRGLMKEVAAQTSGPSAKDWRAMKKKHRPRLVERSLLMKIVAAWVLTVPLAAILSAVVFFIMRALFG